MRSASCLLLLLGLTGTAVGAVPHKRYGCVNGKCAPVKDAGTGLDQCLMSCQGALWPQPSGQVDIGKEYAAVGQPTFDYSGVKGAQAQALMKAMAAQYAANSFSTGGAKQTVKFVVGSDETAISLETDESYVLSVTGAAVSISAGSVFGARHALETLSQLVAYDPAAGAGVQYSMPTAATVKDSPFYPYRGVMVDVARTFFSTDILKTVVRGMGMNKLNRLHLHLVDTASFPLDLESHPELAAAGAYSPEQVYTTADLKEFAAYALEHGVQVIAEIDQPAHAGEGWNAEGENPEVVCTTGTWGSEANEPPSGQFNPANPGVLAKLGDIYNELAGAFRSNTFHVGGDELKVDGCWNSTEHAPALTAFLDAHGYDRSEMKTFFDLWANFTVASVGKLQDAFEKAGQPLEKVMQWAGKDSGVNLLVALGAEGRARVFPKGLFMFQLWDQKVGSFAGTLMEEGYDVVLSHWDQLYMDCGVDGWVSNGKYWCGRVGWPEVYDVLTPKDNNKHLRGAEAAVWSEVIGPSTVLTKTFPRAAALGERLWSNPETTWRSADPRMQIHNARMNARGIASEQTQPEWCLQHGAFSCTV